jgi:hypothetical protein
MSAAAKKWAPVIGARPNMAPTYSVSDLVAVSLTAAVVAVWAEAAGGSFSLLALVACEAAFLAFYLVGSLFAGWRALTAGVLFNLPLRLLVGYAAVNTALFLLAWLSPLGIIANFGILLAVAASLFVATRPVRKPNGVAWEAAELCSARTIAGRDGNPLRVSISDDSVGLLVLGVSLAAATLWCQDSLHPISVQDNTVVFKPWIDGFYHAVHIRIFGASHGMASIEDFRMAGVPARLYHYGAYLTPALVRQASGIHSYTAFAGILAPMGVFFTGLGAYALVGSFWGAWPGLAACAALLLLPDGAQQGMRNTFMSYHWLTQISPSATYGLALLAVAWLFVMRGCTQGSRLQVLAGWLVAGILVFYKLHFFIASALLLLLVPPLFFRVDGVGLGPTESVAGGAGPCQGPASDRHRLGLRKRVLWAVSAVVVYGVTIVCVQKVPGVPLIRFDGSCIGKILSLVSSFTQPEALRDFLADRIGTGRPVLSNLLFGVPFVLLAALGLFAPLLVILAIRLRRRTFPLLVLFPFLLIANFLAMFLGLALDFSRSTPDELSHRPVVVVYFAVVAWVGGAAGLSLLESRRLGRIARPAMVCLAILLMAVPAFLGSGVQRMWAVSRMTRTMSQMSPVRVPIGLVRAAEYMRDHGGAQDIFQDSRFDRTYTVAALSERRAYAARTMTRMSYNSERVEQRADAIEHFMQLRDSAAVTATAREIGLRWFLLNPSDRVDWPAEIASQPAFELDGYRLYRF